MRAIIGVLLASTLLSGAAAAEPSTPYKATPVAEGLDHPWSMAFLPDGTILVTERKGQLRAIRNGKLDPKPIAGVPSVYTKINAQAGLFDVVLHPSFAQNNVLYLVYAHGDGAANATRVARATFDGTALSQLTPIFTASPTKDTANHYGGRMVFLSDGTFLLTLGDGFEYREKAQDLSSDLGKIVRLNDDGTPASGNSFANRAGARAEIWTLGHRNEQGLFFDAATGRVWEHEHGPRGGDELNLIEPGKNYGWPLVTFGRDYSGALVSPYTEKPGLQAPVLTWTPSIAPSGLTVYHGDKFPAWEGDAFVGALAFKHLRRVDLDANGAVLGQEELLMELGQRIRDVRTSPDGYLYVSTDDANGQVLKIEPK